MLSILNNKMAFQCTILIHVTQKLNVFVTVSQLKVNAITKIVIQYSFVSIKVIKIPATHSQKAICKLAKFFIITIAVGNLIFHTMTGK